MERGDFLSKVQLTIKTNNLFTKDSNILVGVSGGVDSTVLVYALHSLGYAVSIAHCNFKLRGAESDGDQLFVEKFAQKLQIPIHVRTFETSECAKENKESIEMSARNLRYEWFRTLIELHGYTHVAIAHNQNDSVETFFINLLRSSGIKGLTGIPIKNGNIVRPLLEVSRLEIEEFANLSGLAYRVDSSNLSNDFVRNKIRNIILPELKKISPQAVQSVTTSMLHLRETYALYSEAVDVEKQRCCRVMEDGVAIDEQLLQQHSHSETILFEILYPYGFNADVVSQIYHSFESQSGKQFESDTYVATHDRNTLYVHKKSVQFDDEILITEQMTQVTVAQMDLLISRVGRETFVLEKSPSVASLDTNKLKFPLIVRKWQNGDSFVPFGMKGKKKISDYLIDAKVPLHKKDSIYVVESAGEIVWLIGYRISQNYAVSAETQNILKIKMMDK